MSDVLGNVNTFLNTMATALVATALVMLALTLWDGGFRLLAVGASVWAGGFVIRLAAILMSTDTSEPLPLWARTLVRDYAWTYRTVGGLTLYFGVLAMRERRRMDRALEHRVNGIVEV